MTACEIIAEIGVNWNGDLSIAEQLIKNSKEAGFSAVKFQAFGPEHWTKYPQFPDLEHCSIHKVIPEIDKLAKKYNIEWYATPTNTAAVDLLEPYVKRYKIRHADQANQTLLSKILATKKGVIISTLKPQQFAKNIKTLYCIPKYPTEYDEIDFKQIPYYYGYSNHCKDKRAVIEAAKRGAKMIEIHVTPSYDLPFIDNWVSFDMKDCIDIICTIQKL